MQTERMGQSISVEERKKRLKVVDHHASEIREGISLLLRTPNMQTLFSLHQARNLGEILSPEARTQLEETINALEGLPEVVATRKVQALDLKLTAIRGDLNTF